MVGAAVGPPSKQLVQRPPVAALADLVGHLQWRWKLRFVGLVKMKVDPQDQGELRPPSLLVGQGCQGVQQPVGAEVVLDASYQRRIGVAGVL
jgi:hypothetical protein